MATVQELTVLLTANAKGLIGALTTSANAVKKFGQGATKDLSSMQKGFSSAAAQIEKFVVPLAAAATAFVGFKSVMESFEKAESLKTLSDDLGVTTASLQKLHFAAATSGSSAEAMDKALATLSGKLHEISDPASKTAKSLSDIGLSASDMVGLSADEAFAKVADSLSKVSNQSVRASAGMDLLGKSSRSLGSVISGGSAGLKSAGDEAERLGVILTKLDLAKMSVANDAMDRLREVMTSLADKLAVKLAPVLEYISDLLVQQANDINGPLMTAFDGMVNGIVFGVGLIKTVWQGLEVLWQGAKVITANMSVWFYEAARGITKAFLFIKEEVGLVWDWIQKSLSTTVQTLMYSWTWFKTHTIGVFSDVAVAFGRMVISIGETAAKSRIKGLSDIGRAAQDAGADLVIGAIKLKEGVKEELQGAGASLEVSRQELIKARENLSKGPEVKTPYLDQMVDNAKRVRSEWTKTFRDLTYMMASQTGGNAVSQTFSDYSTKHKQFIDEASKRESEASDKRAVVMAADIDKYQKYLADKSARDEDYRFNLLKREVDAYEAIDNIEKNKVDVNRVAMAEIDRVHAEFMATRQARDYQALDDLILRKEKAEEQLTSITVNREQERATIIAEYRAQYQREEYDSQMKTAAMWESGYRGKMEVLGGFFDSMSVLMESKNRQMFEVGKAASIASTIIATIESAQKSYNSLAGIPYVGPVLGAAAAAAAAAAGLIRVQQIRSTKFGDKSAPGNVSMGGSVQSGSQAAQQQAQQSSSSNVNVTLVGDRFGPNQVRSLIGAINDAAGDNVRITTSGRN